MTHRPPRRGDEGQASVELALTLPVLAVFVLAIVQAVVIGRDHLLVAHAARGAAREAAVDQRPAAIRKAALSAAPALKPARVSTEASYGRGSPDIVTVSIRYRAPTVVMVVGSLLPDVVVEAKAAFRVEPDTDGPNVATE